MKILTVARQLASVRRYSRDFSIAPESVLEHLGFCVIFCLHIGMRLQNEFRDVDIGNLLTRAALHDIEEAHTGDIPRNTKHANAKTKAAFDGVAEAAAIEICETNFGGREMYNIWCDAKKDDTIEGKIVALSDYAAVTYQVSNEIYKLGNNSFARVRDEALGFLETKLSVERDEFFIEQYKTLRAILKGDIQI